MNKHLIFAGGFTLGICASLFCIGLQNANAQNSVSAVVGNPGSSNAVIVEETYGVITEPAAVQQPAATNDAMAPLPDSPGVEVAPPPGQTPEDMTPDAGSDADMEIDEVDEIVETD